MIENLNEIGKKKVASQSATVEKELVFPLLRGRDIGRWKAKPSINILIAQNLAEPSKAIDMISIQKNYPHAFDFLQHFKAELTNRALYKKYLESQGVPFYGIYNIGLYTFAPYKVVWKEQSSSFECSVVSSIGSRIIVPDHKLMMVPFQTEEEAHYLCSLLNSTISMFIVRAYCVSTQQSTHILDNIKVSKYDRTNELHRDLAALSKKCHEKVAAGIEVADSENQIDNLAAELWGLSKEELKDITDSLEEIK